MLKQKDLDVMNKRNQRSVLFLLTAGFFSAIGLNACSVDFKGFVYDDDKYDEKLNAGGAPGDSASGDGDSDNLEFCDQFCEDSADVCLFGSDLGYESKNDCMDACAGFDVDALECRIFRLKSAEDDPDTHCPSTLLDGGGVCPDATPNLCDDFCSGSAVTCPFGSARGYKDEDECLSTCATFNEEQMDCRQTHLGFAEMGSPETHCLHTLLDGGGVCPDATPDRCATFCNESDEICGFGSDLGFEDLDDCEDACALFDDEAFNCRKTHLNFAASDAAGHCGHTLLDGGGVCPDLTN